MSRRVFLKLSGEGLAGDKKTGFDEATVKMVAKQVKKSVDAGVQIGIIIGGGNFWRGRSSTAIERTHADQIGMLATVMNCIYTSEIFRSEGMKTEIYTPFACGTMTKLFSKDAANADFEDGKVIFFAGGTGHPYFSTDMGVALRAIEMDAECILMAKAIDGVYTADPKKDPEAKKFDKVSLSYVVKEGLQVIDLTAAQMCLDNKMNIAVFSLLEEDGITKALNGDISGGTVVTAD